MKRLACMMLIILAATPELRAQPQYEPYATRMVRVVGERGVNERFLEDLVNQPSVADELSREVYGRPWQEIGNRISFRRSESVPSGAYYMVTLSMSTEADRDPEKADEFLGAVLERLIDLLHENHNRFVAQQEQLIQQVRKKIEQSSREIEELRQVRTKVVELSDGRVLTYQQALEAQQEAAERLRDIETDARVMAETRDVLARRIAEIAEEAGDRAESDEILQQLKELLALKEEAMNQRARMVEAGHVSEAEMQAARAEVIQTRIEIARRREALTRDRIGERLDNLNARLDDLLIEATRLHTMQQVAEERLAQIRERDLVGLAEKLGEVEMKLRSATDELRQRENVLYQLNADPDKVRLPQIDVVD